MLETEKKIPILALVKFFYSFVKRRINLRLKKLSLWKKTITFRLTDGKSLRKFRNIHQGESCWIIGNGPSLNQTDLDLLKEQYTFALNAMVLHEKFEQIKPTYYVATNPSLMQSDFLKDDVLPLIKKLGIKAFLNIEVKERIGHSHENLFYLLSTENPSLTERTYNLDITKLLLGTKVSVIIQAAIPIAVYMGFKTIYLVGCDSDYHNLEPDKHHFYDETINSNIKKLYAYAKKLYPAYYENPAQSCNQYYLDSMEEWITVNKRLSAKGVKIYNCTVGGKLEVFPRLTLECALKENST